MVVAAERISVTLRHTKASWTGSRPASPDGSQTMMAMSWQRQRQGEKKERERRQRNEDSGRGKR